MNRLHDLGLLRQRPLQLLGSKFLGSVKRGAFKLQIASVRHFRRSFLLENCLYSIATDHSRQIGQGIDLIPSRSVAGRSEYASLRDGIMSHKLMTKQIRIFSCIFQTKIV